MLFGFYGTAPAQTVAIGTNLFDWADLGTINLEAGVSFARHFSAEVGGRYNPWTFHKAKSGLTIKNQQATAFAGVRYWPWYVFSGWWISAKAQFSKYSETGIWRYALDEGKAVGAGISFGYTLMLNKKLNIEFGIGCWGGAKLSRTLYHCPNCMIIREQGNKGFFFFFYISISLIYVL